MTKGGNMKKSIYNLYTENKDGKRVIYNSYTGKQVRFEKEMEKEYENILNDNFHLIKKEHLDLLISSGILVDEDEFRELNNFYNGIVFNQDFLEITVLPTDACNFRCVYCYQSGPYHNMNSDTANSLLVFLEKNCRKYKRVLLGWFGGEPLLQKDMVIYMTEKAKEICQKNGVAFVSRMSTNGYELDLETAKKLVKSSLLFYQITIDGTKETHNIQRPHIVNKDSYQKIMYNLIEIKNNIRASQLSIACRINVSERNYEALNSFLDEFKKQFGDDVRFKVVVEPVHDWGGENIEKNRDMIIDNKLHEIVKRFCESAAEKGVQVLMPMDFGRGTLLCEAARKNSLVFNYNGDLLKCTSAIYAEGAVRDINRIGHIDKQGNCHIDENLEKQWLKRDEDETIERYECKDCIGYPLCGGSSCVLATNIIRAGICENKQRIADYIEGIVVYNDLTNNYIEIA